MNIRDCRMRKLPDMSGEKGRGLLQLRAALRTGLQDKLRPFSAHGGFRTAEDCADFSLPAGYSNIMLGKMLPKSFHDKGGIGKADVGVGRKHEWQPETEGRRREPCY